MKSNDLVLNASKLGFITEKEINLLKKRINSGEEIDMTPVYNSEIILDNSQSAKPLSFLINLWKTKKGNERKSNPFGYREKSVLENFSKFIFKGFYNVGIYNNFYVPIYQCCSEKGSFEYYYWRGEINITG